MSLVEGKYALVTGGAQGIGIACIKELLINGVQGITMVDIDAELGEESTALVQKEFGKEKVIFVQADVSKPDQVEEAFKKSYEHWNHLDVVINNAGIVSEQNWESALWTNCGGLLQGTLMGFRYMSKRQGGRGGVVVNLASMAGIIPVPIYPVYSATKAFVVMLGRCFGDSIYCDHNDVKILTVCPANTTTNMVQNSKPSETLCPNIKEIVWKRKMPQSPEEVAKLLVTVVMNGNSGSVWTIITNQAKEVDFSATDDVLS